MRFRPDEPGVDESDGAVGTGLRRRALADALDAAEAQREELLGLWRGAGPVLGRLEVALAGSAPEDGELVNLIY